MHYIMIAGSLYDKQKNKVFVHAKGRFIGPEKKILSADGVLLLQSDIRRTNTSDNKTSDIRYTEYILQDGEGNKCAIAKPSYAAGEDPAEVGWPINRMPKVDHAQVMMDGQEYGLVMQNSQNYALADHTGNIVIRILHRGLMGGWNIEANDRFSPEIVCGIFMFCRYIEQENEFMEPLI